MGLRKILKKAKFIRDRAKYKYQPMKIRNVIPMGNKLINIFLLTILLFAPLQLKAESEDKYIAISSMFKDVAEVNQEIANNDDDVKLQILLQEKSSLFRHLMLVIRGSFIDYQVAGIDNDELKLLRSKISINRSRGNSVAVQRDQYDIDFIMTKRAIGEFVVYLVDASRNYKPEEDIVGDTKQKIKQIKQKIKATPEPIQGDSPIYQDLAQNHADLLKIYAVNLDFLEYVLANPDTIVTTSFFQKMSLISLISYINSFDIFRNINFKIAPLRIDMGGIIISLCIVILNLIAFSIGLQNE